MGTYLRFVAKPGCEDQINDAYSAISMDPKQWLVYSERVIADEIAFIHSSAGESQAHLRRHVRTMQDWESHFPNMRRGTGKIKLSAINDERESPIKRDIKFIIEHRKLFKSIDGIDEAFERGLCDFAHDLLFNDLPSGACEVFRLCCEHGCPELWMAYHGFKTSPCEETWEVLRTRLVPWHGRMTVCARVKEWARFRNGQDFESRGRFRDGNLPSIRQLRAALRAPSRAAPVT